MHSDKSAARYKASRIACIWIYTTLRPVMSSHRVTYTNVILPPLPSFVVDAGVMTAAAANKIVLTRQKCRQGLTSLEYVVWNALLLSHASSNSFPKGVRWRMKRHHFERYFTESSSLHMYSRRHHRRAFHVYWRPMGLFIVSIMFSCSLSFTVRTICQHERWRLSLSLSLS